MDRVLSLIEHYGYLVVLFGVMAESTGAETIRRGGKHGNESKSPTS